MPRYLSGAVTLTEQAYMLARHAEQPQERGLWYWVCADAKQAQAAAEQLQLFVHVFSVPDFSVSLLDLGLAGSPQVLFDLKGRQGAAVLSLADFTRLPLMISLLSEQTTEYRVKERLSPQQMKQRLVKLGYEEGGEGAYAFSSRGGTIQVSANDQQPWRCVFGEEFLEDITAPDGSRRTSIILLPPHLDASSLPEKSAAVPLGKVICDESMEQKLLNKLDVHWSKEAVVLKPFSSPAADGYAFTKVKHYRRDFASAVADMRNHLRHKDRVLVSSVDTDVTKTMLERHDLDLSGIILAQQTAPMEGFYDKKHHFVLYTHASLFGRSQVKKKKRRDDSAFVTTLKTNEYVVHEDHGVGRYLGLVSSKIEGHERENLLIEYAKGDRLYVPVELAYKVDRYVGEAKPALQRLSGTSWVRLTRKATQDSQEFARDLLKLYARRSLVRVDPWHVFSDADREMHASFGFQETPDQESAIRDVYEGLANNEPMDRLIVGDVGFGKTEVAIRAAYQAFLNKKQAVILCPTTLLAQQHYDTFTERLKPFGVRVEMLSRFTGHTKDSSVTVADVIAALKSGQVDVIIGTHRLLSKDVDLSQAGIIIIDEEQRFGVRHKERLKDLRTQAHILTLSATPIPRTLYFSLSGLREISTITTPPHGRQPIETYIEPYSDVRVQQAISEELGRGGQVFYLYNHVQTIHTAKRRLQDILGEKVRIAIVHGQMPEDEMARVTQEFDHGRIDVLVCTTIIESGLDIPNVNTLIVENATRFGLGQLYQIRGRIGRGSARAHALFLYPSEGMTGVAARRLQILQEAKALGSGFQLAMRDLEMRGMGQLVGKRQHGHIQNVGLGMYGRLLRQAVEDLEDGHVSAYKPSTTISLPLDYGIPTSLIADPEERSRLYRQLSQAESPDDIDHTLRPYQASIASLTDADRQKIENLKQIISLRKAASQHGISAIDYQETEGIDGRKKSQLALEFVELKPHHVERLIPLVPDFKVSGNKILIKSEDLNDYLQDITKIVGIFD